MPVRIYHSVSREKIEQGCESAVGRANTAVVGTHRMHAAAGNGLGIAGGVTIKVVSVTQDKAEVSVTVEGGAGALSCLDGSAFTAPGPDTASCGMLVGNGGGGAGGMTSSAGSAGDPVDGGGRFIDAAALGIYRGEASGGAFEQMYSGAVSCLTWSAAGIFACTSQAERGFAQGLASPQRLMLEGAAAFEPSLSLMDVQGPLECSRCASGARCLESWPATCLAWGREDCDAPLVESAGGAGACVADGSAEGGRDDDHDDGDDHNDDAATAGCGCGTAPSHSTPGLVVALSLASLLRRRLRAGLSLLTLLGLAGCSQADTEAPPGDSECGGSFDEFALGMHKMLTPEALRLELYAAEPAPPVVRDDNVWRVALSGADGEPVSGAELEVSPFMPKHQHGAAFVVVEEIEEGRYELSPIELIMPGVWEIRFRVTPDASSASEATFHLCIAER